MLGKWINDSLVTPSVNERKKLVIANPTDEILKFVQGYKNVELEPEPEYDETKQYLKLTKLSETDTELKLGWEVEDVQKEMMIDETDS